MHAIHTLQLHVTHRCNLYCQSCSHYSNQGHRGDIACATADAWMAKWKSRLAPSRFSLLGGEPTLHPQLVEIIYIARSHWPETALQVISNGFFLGRHKGLPKALEETGCQLTLSIHHDDQEYTGRMASVSALVKEWRRSFAFNLDFYGSYRNWTQRYLGYGAAMQPYADGDSKASWTLCPAKHCCQLHEGRLWKCPPLAYLRMQDEKFSLGRDWDPYLAYKPLDPDCSQEDIMAFFKLKEESYCGMCPAYSRPIKKPNPMHPPQAGGTDAAQATG